MDNKQTIICLGHNENATLFNASGIKGIVIRDKDEIKKRVKTLVDEGIKIFLVSEVFHNEINELRNTYDSVYPIFLLLPLDGFTNDDGVERIRKDVERATGVNLF